MHIMKKYAIKHPIIFELILVVVSLVLTVAVSILLQFLYLSNEITMALARIVAGGVLFIVFLYCFKPKKQFSSFPTVLPGLLFAVWNIANCFMSDGHIEPFSIETLIQAIAPAIFEEVIFREIFIYHLKENGQSPLMCTIISALVFGLVHLTNVVGASLIQTLIQVGYAIVVGLVFGAIYTRSDDLIFLIIVHCLIDLSSRIFVGGTVASYLVFIPFFILLIGESIYAIKLVSKD